MLLIKSGKVYDTLKWIALVALPAIGTAYYAVSQVWGLPDAEKVVGTIVIIDTLLGALLHISTETYHKNDNNFDGVAQVIQNEDKKTYHLALNDDPHDLDQKKSITFRVEKIDNPAKKTTDKRTTRKQPNSS